MSAPIETTPIPPQAGKGKDGDDVGESTADMMLISALILLLYIACMVTIAAVLDISRENSCTVAPTPIQAPSMHLERRL